MLTGAKINKSYLVLLCFFTASYDSLNSLWHAHTLLMIRISSAGSNQFKKKIISTIQQSAIPLQLLTGEVNNTDYLVTMASVKGRVNTQVFRLMCMSMGLIRALSVLYIFYGESASRIDMTFWFRRRGFEIRGRKFHGVKIDPWNSHSNELDVECRWNSCQKTAIWTRSKAHLCKWRLVSLVWLYRRASVAQFHKKFNVGCERSQNIQSIAACSVTTALAESPCWPIIGAFSGGHLSIRSEPGAMEGHGLV